MLLKQKLRSIYRGEAFNGKPTKTARSHGKKFQVSVRQEISRILVITWQEVSIRYLANSEFISFTIEFV